LNEKKIRVLVSKPGLDGHDVGAKVIAQALRDSGMEVIDVLVVIGGNIPGRDVEALKALGIKEVFPTGSRFEAIVDFIKNNVKS
jgi:methylmalonyl-CoA mutase C-terminal domain/subunit